MLSVNFTCMTALLLMQYRDFYSHRMQPQPKPAQIFFFRPQVLLFVPSALILTPIFLVSDLKGGPCTTPSTHRPPPPKGINSRSTLWGEEKRKRGSCRPFRAHQKDPVWNGDQPTDGDAAQLRGYSVTASLQTCFLHPPTLFSLLAISKASSSWIHLYKRSLKGNWGQMFCFSSWGRTSKDKCLIL